MPNENVQTFYRCPYSPLSFFIIIAFNLVAYICLKFAAVFAKPQVAVTLHLICVAEFTFVLGLSFIAILIDPGITFSKTRKVQDNGGGGGGSYKYKVKRPLFGFKNLKYYLDSPAGMADVWWDGARYERAVFEL
ncbi:uncharacterized protein ASPGLDRAFT_1475036 [Aspergillus glaucus CBS 516.65]|uniref:Uncharacterized protein n=1 Tax=Aspergillus glaucus CBS 516.65 TaxID=1160497 RepID=A0A1L9VLK9_ASPGL|nr:hypothetical protein ASPGLDRAFT_1475036 [Aspergillus glaucus CBS 516.65]OJJ84817.1 hypothetical protein ASPGLDRAFT_1475036 [Aspergillus glaucus CBS 516.65]